MFFSDLILTKVLRCILYNLHLTIKETEDTAVMLMRHSQVLNPDTSELKACITLVTPYCLSVDTHVYYLWVVSSFAMELYLWQYFAAWTEA